MHAGTHGICIMHVTTICMVVAIVGGPYDRSQVIVAFMMISNGAIEKY